MKIRMLSVLLIAALILSCVPVAFADNLPQYNVTMLNAWKGSSANFPLDQANNACADFIRQKFGLTFTMSDSGSEMSESQFINNLVMADALPDVINSAYWNSNVNGQGWQRVDAAKQGMVKNIAPFLGDYPNLNAAIGQYLSADVRRFLVYNTDFDGAMYFVPVMVNANAEEYATVYGDTVYARQDVLDAIGVKAEDVRTMDDLYALLTSIKNSDLTDWNGREIIPLGLNSGAWRLPNVFEWLNGNNISNFRLDEEGNVTHYVLTDYLSKRIKYVQKLLKEGLLDPEGFSITSEDANARISQGSYAVMPIDTNAATTYYYDYTAKDHPEAVWVPLNLTNQDGNNTVDVWQPGWTGGHMTWFAHTIDEGKLRAILSMMDWMCTQEGILFNTYGIEGVHYDMVDGKPVRKAEYAEIGSDTNKNAGINQFLKFVVLENLDTLFPRSIDEMSEREAYKFTLDNTFRPRVEVDKISVDNLLKNWEGNTDMNDKINAYDLGTLVERAYFYETEEEVDDLIEQIQQDYIDFGVEQAAQYITDNFTDGYAY